MSQTVLHQFLTGATSGDAITGQALLMRGWLRELGFVAEIYALHIHPSVEDQIRPLTSYRRARHEKWAIYRHSIGSDVPEFLQHQGLRLLLIYHNVTPPEFFDRSDPMRAALARKGQAQLHSLKELSGFALADSAYNELDLKAVGFLETAVLPVTLDPERYNLPINEALAVKMGCAGPNLLFVSRLAPNKKQEDLVKLLYYVRCIQPQARLYLLGDRWEVGYDVWVEQLAADLDITDGLIVTGKVSQADMRTYYKNADLYVSMSEHEGFGLPLVESMYLGLPVLAYGVTAVPYTMRDAGVLFFEKKYAQLAELVQILTTNRPLRERIITRQKTHAARFLAPQVRHEFIRCLQNLGLVTPEKV